MILIRISLERCDTLEAGARGRPAVPSAERDWAREHGGTWLEVAVLDGRGDEISEKGAEFLRGFEGEATALHLQKAFTLKLAQKTHRGLRAEADESSELRPAQGEVKGDDPPRRGCSVALGEVQELGRHAAPV